MYIDFHSHVLPGADHGSDSIEMSLSQLERAKEAGIDTIVATPHFYPSKDDVEEFLARRERAYNELAKVNTTGIKIVKAAEVQLAVNVHETEGLEKLCIEGTNYILVEFPQEPWPYWIFDSLTAIIREKRLRPVCAHIDRYSHIGRDRILSFNIDIQVNASAFTDTRRRRNYYINLVSEDSVHLLGSDTHGDGKVSYKEFSVAAKKLGNYMPYLTENANKIIASGEKNQSK